MQKYTTLYCLWRHPEQQYNVRSRDAGSKGTRTRTFTIRGKPRARRSWQWRALTRRSGKGPSRLCCALSRWPMGLVASVRANLVRVGLRQVRLVVVRPLQALGTAVGLAYATEASTQVNTPAEVPKATPGRLQSGDSQRGRGRRKTRAYPAPTTEKRPLPRRAQWRAPCPHVAPSIATWC